MLNAKVNTLIDRSVNITPETVFLLIFLPFLLYNYPIQTLKASETLFYLIMKKIQKVFQTLIFSEHEP